jgi:hypothetical protein
VPRIRAFFGKILARFIAWLWEQHHLSRIEIGALPLFLQLREVAATYCPGGTYDSSLARSAWEGVNRKEPSSRDRMILWESCRDRPTCVTEQVPTRCL